MKTLIYFCLFALIIFIFGGCKDDTVAPTSGGNPSVNLIEPHADTTLFMEGNYNYTIFFSWSATNNPDRYILNTYVHGVSHSYPLDSTSCYIPNTGTCWWYWQVLAIYGNDTVISEGRKFFLGDYP
jgi:hypothetical protein